MEKKFIRFVCNTKDHPRGEKIKALNIVAKVYNDKGNFLYVRKPYIYAQENQIEIDVEGFDYKQYLPLHHFKVNNGNIIKKNDIEIENIEKEIKQRRQQKEIEREQKEKEKKDNENIIEDNTKSDKEKLSALVKLYKNK